MGAEGQRGAMHNFGDKVSFIGSVADPIRDSFKRRDDKDGEVGIVGYEIEFNRYFHADKPPRPLEEIEADIRTLEKEIIDMPREVAA